MGGGMNPKQNSIHQCLKFNYSSTVAGGGYCSYDDVIDADDVGRRRGLLWMCHAVADIADFDEAVVRVVDASDGSNVRVTDRRGSRPSQALGTVDGGSQASSSGIGSGS
ncbi:hypothetical protein ACLOJK_027416 [Asimina triloba]